MAVLNTPINTDDENLKQILRQNLPVAIYLYNGSEKPDKPLEDTVSRLAKKYAGELLIARINTATNPKTYTQYNTPVTPAIITLTRALMGKKIKSQATAVRPADVRAHVEYLLDKGPHPAQQTEEKPAAAGDSAPNTKAASQINDASFKKVVLRSEVPVLVDFWAPWCAPCRTIAPFIDKMADEYAGQVKVVKLNVDENPRTARQFNVQSIPTVIIFRNGEVLEQRVGANPGAIRSMIQESLRA
jgi:thioredoxin 1